MVSICLTKITILGDVEINKKKSVELIQFPKDSLFVKADRI